MPAAGSARQGEVPRAGREGRPPLVRKSFLKHLALALCSLALSLALVEAGVRMAGLRPDRQALPRYLGWDGERWVEEGTWGRGTIKRASPFEGVEMGEYVPGARFRIVYPSDPRGYFDGDGGVPARINRLGLRGAEVSAEKPPGVFRVLGIGDSFTFGVGVRDEDTWLERLGPLLAGLKGGRRFEVLNAGVGGYGTADQVRYLEGRWLELDPDLVLVGFYLNDAYSESTFNAYLAGRQLLLQEPAGLARRSRALDLLVSRFRAWRLRRGIDAFYRQHYFSDAAGFLGDPRNEAADWRGARRALERGLEITRARGAGMALVIFPDLHRLDGGYPFEDIHRFVREQCDTLGLPVLDLLDAFRGMEAEKLWVHPADHHPNEVAHRLAAEAVARFLADPSRGLLGRRVRRE